MELIPLTKRNMKVEAWDLNRESGITTISTTGGCLRTSHVAPTAVEFCGETNRIHVELELATIQQTHCCGIDGNHERIVWDAGSASKCSPEALGIVLLQLKCRCSCFSQCEEKDHGRHRKSANHGACNRPACCLSCIP